MERIPRVKRGLTVLFVVPHARSQGGLGATFHAFMHGKQNNGHAIL